MKYRITTLLLCVSVVISANAAIVITEKDNRHQPTNVPWGWAIAQISGSRDSLSVQYRDNKTDGHCAYVKTRRVRIDGGKRVQVGRTIEHGQNCSTSRLRSASHGIFGDGGGAKLCLSGHWYCGGWRDQF